MKKIILIVITFAIFSCGVSNKPALNNADTLFIEVPEMYSGYVITDIEDLDSNNDSIPDVSVAIISNGILPDKEIWMAIDVGQFYNEGDTLGKEYENYE